MVYESFFQTIEEASTQAGINYGLAILLVGVILIWTLVWKLSGMWKAAKKGSVFWFIILAVVNTIGILPILYIYVFSKMKLGKKKKVKEKKKPVRKKK